MYHPPRKIDAVGEKRANYFAQIMFKHSLDIEAAFSAESVNVFIGNKI